MIWLTASMGSATLYFLIPYFLLDGLIDGDDDCQPGRVTSHISRPGTTAQL